MEYLFLWLSAFSSATLLPGSSEVYFSFLYKQNFSPWLLFAVATLGNLAGSAVNWWLGKKILVFRHKRWFYFSAQQLERGQTLYQRYGIWSLLFAWLPIVGDLLTVAAGLMKAPFGRFLILVGLGKGARYGALLLLLNGWFGG